MLMNNPEDLHQMVLNRYDELICWYEKNKKIQRNFDYTLQVAVVLATGMAVFAASIETWPRWTIVLPAVITTISSSLSTAFRFRSKYVNFAHAGEMLKSSKLRFQIKSAGSSELISQLEESVDSIEFILSRELDEWREGYLSADMAKKSPAEKQEKP